MADIVSLSLRAFNAPAGKEQIDAAEHDREACILSREVQRPVWHLGTLERVTHHHSCRLNRTLTSKLQMVFSRSLVAVVYPQELLMFVCFVRLLSLTLTPSNFLASWILESLHAS